MSLIIISAKCASGYGLATILAHVTIGSGKAPPDPGRRHHQNSGSFGKGRNRNFGHRAHHAILLRSPAEQLKRSVENYHIWHPRRRLSPAYSIDDRRLPTDTDRNDPDSSEKLPHRTSAPPEGPVAALSGFKSLAASPDHPEHCFIAQDSSLGRRNATIPFATLRVCSASLTYHEGAIGRLARCLAASLYHHAAQHCSRQPKQLWCLATLCKTTSPSAAHRTAGGSIWMDAGIQERLSLLRLEA